MLHTWLCTKHAKEYGSALKDEKVHWRARAGHICTKCDRFATHYVQIDGEIKWNLAAIYGNHPLPLKKAICLYIDGCLKIIKDNLKKRKK